MTTNRSSASRRWVLMNPGPVNTAEEVRAALGGPDLCHREPEFTALMTRVRQKVTAVCGGTAEHTSIVLTGSGTSALEAAVGVIPDEGGLLVVDNGHYGQRLYEIATVVGIRCVRLELGWGTPVDPDRVDEALAADPALTHVAVVHHETSTGMLNDVATLAAVARRHGCRIVVDAISSVGAEPVDLARDGIDWLVGTSNKCLEGMPGLSFVSAAHSDFAALTARAPRSYCLDLGRHYQAQEHVGAPAFTPSVPLFYAFETALDLALAEGTVARGARYRRLAERLRAGLSALGLRILVDPLHRAVGLTAVGLPEGLTFALVHRALKDEGFVVYAAQEQLSDGFFRLSTMGAMDERDIDAFLAVFARLLPQARRIVPPRAHTGIG